MPDLYLGLDVSTQGCKAVLYDGKAVVARGSTTYDVSPSSVPGRSEQNPRTWIAGMKVAVRQALAGCDPGDVKAMGVGGQQHGLVVLDANKQLLRDCKLWNDTESAAEAQELSSRLGYVVVASYTMTKLLWLQRHEPEVWQRSRHICLPHDYVNLYLTGQLAMEAGDASGTGLLNSSTRQWDTSVAQLISPKLLGMLPKLLGPDEAVGRLLPQVAVELGLPPHLVVSAGSGDNAMAALGVGAVRDGQVVISLGTSGTLFVCSSKPLALDPTGTVCAFCNASGGWLPLVCTLNCTRVAEEVCRAFGLTHDQLTTLAMDEPAACGGVNFVPFLCGERTPNLPGASGVLTGLRPGCLRPGLLYRAALEGSTLSLLAGLASMEQLGLAHPTQLLLVGGGARNLLWRQIVADAFGLPVKLPREDESAALGAAFQAAACHQGESVRTYVEQRAEGLLQQGTAVQPIASNTVLYRQALQRQQLIAQRLFCNRTE